MTMTESPPQGAAEANDGAANAAKGLYLWLSTSDNKVIARIWLMTASLLMAAGLALGVAVSAERLDPDNVGIFGGVNAYFQMWGLYRFGMVLLVAIPLLLGLAIAVVPGQVGSREIAFPRAALAAAWGYVLGAGIVVAAVLAGGGWGAIDGVTTGEADAMALTLTGTGLVMLSIIIGSICVLTTVISLRTPGMNLMRVPLFAWSMLVAATVWVLTLPVAIANIVVIYVDLRGGPLVFGEPEGSTMIYDQLAWLFEQPQIYSIAIPALGVFGSVVPVVAKGRQVSHPAMMALLGLAGVLSVGGWSQPILDGDHRDLLVYVAFGLAAVLPALAYLGGNAATLKAGEAPVGVPPMHLVGALGAGLLFLAATAAGAARVVDPFDLIGTTADTGVMNLALAAALLGGVTGLFFWSPVVWGRLLPSGSMTLVALLLLGGGLLVGLSDVVAGFADAPDVMLAEEGGQLIDVMVLVSLAGAALMALGGLGLLSSLVGAVRNETSAVTDPWGGQTLEWTTSEVWEANKVTSEAPLLDLARLSSEGDDGGEA